MAKRERKSEAETKAKPPVDDGKSLEEQEKKLTMERITVKVPASDHEGESVQEFLLSPGTPLRNLFNAFTQTNGLSEGEAVFIRGARLLDPDQCPVQLGWKVGETVEVEAHPRSGLKEIETPTEPATAAAPAAEAQVPEKAAAAPAAEAQDLVKAAAAPVAEAQDPEKAAAAPAEAQDPEKAAAAPAAEAQDPEKAAAAPAAEAQEKAAAAPAAAHPKASATPADWKEALNRKDTDLPADLAAEPAAEAELTEGQKNIRKAHYMRFLRSLKSPALSQFCRVKAFMIFGLKRFVWQGKQTPKSIRNLAKQARAGHALNL